ncbi:HIT-like domain-containing protein [Blyttiomyces helicus]|uniref:HIT-like domain-containing protein n=1 Tax=Blyttiomyces helicus TaxID=388810 RepID=A0A4P9WQS8_9FUNG|nr:HIT-like domain-containing protein [Blyttiomyces helicus]|eukprot:RKO94543.1 HIT-like domain-containing protein [Blyttiomyces helicus]
MSAAAAANCIFCKIIKGQIPSFKLAETELSYAFLDVNPIAKGHALVIPKHHAQFFHEVPDENLADLLPLAKKVATAIGAPNYNLLQNNGRIALDHVHFHIIPKNEKEGLGIDWPVEPLTKEALEALGKELSSKIAA